MKYSIVAIPYQLIIYLEISKHTIDPMEILSQ